MLGFNGGRKKLLVRRENTPGDGGDQVRQKAPGCGTGPKITGSSRLRGGQGKKCESGLQVQLVRGVKDPKLKRSLWVQAPRGTGCLRQKRNDEKGGAAIHRLVGSVHKIIEEKNEKPICGDLQKGSGFNWHERSSEGT